MASGVLSTGGFSTTTLRRRRLWALRCSVLSCPDGSGGAGTGWETVGTLSWRAAPAVSSRSGPPVGGRSTAPRRPRSAASRLTGSVNPPRRSGPSCGRERSAAPALPNRTTPDPHTRWHSEAEALDIDPVALTASFETAARREPDDYDRAELVLSRAHQAAPTAVADAVVAQLEQLGQASRGLGRPDILRTLWATLNAGAALGGQDIDVEAELGRLATELWDHATSRLVERDGRWYSAGLASAEVAAVSWLASDAQPATAVADTDGLGGDQAAAVATILNSATRGVVVLGPAGAGKTEMLSRVAAAVGADRVLAVAPTAEAAANLGAALGVVRRNRRPGGPVRRPGTPRGVGHRRRSQPARHPHPRRPSRGGPPPPTLA